MKVLPAKKCIGEEGIYLTKECDLHGKFRTLIWEGSVADYLSWGRENLSAETPVNPKSKEKACPNNCGLCEEHERKAAVWFWKLQSAAIFIVRSVLLRQVKVRRKEILLSVK